MSEERPKKKRYEGLIQFKDALRQTIVCLQASMENRFAHSLHSPWIRKLDDENASLYHLLFSMGIQNIGQVAGAEDICEHHLLTSIHQQQTSDLRSEITWKADLCPKISAWIDPSDQLVSSLLFRVISLACNSIKPFDLKDCLAWGGVIKSGEWKNLEEGQNFLEGCQKQFGLSSQRMRVLKAFLAQSLDLMCEGGTLHLVGDGLVIGVLVEGLSTKREAEILAGTLVQLPPGSAGHTLIANRPQSVKEPLQLALLTSVRTPSLLKGSASLKGFVLLSNIRSQAKIKGKAKLAG